jgi:hypothetical protein
LIEGILGKIGGIFDRHFLLAYLAPACVSVVLGLTLIIYQLGASSVVALWNKLGLVEQIGVGITVLIFTTVLAYMMLPFEGSIVRLLEGFWPEEWRLTLWARGCELRRLDAIREEVAALAIPAVSDPNMPAGKQAQLAYLAELVRNAPPQSDEASATTGRPTAGIQREQESKYVQGDEATASSSGSSETDGLNVRRKAVLDERLLLEFPRDRVLVRPTRLGNALAAATNDVRQRYGISPAIWWPRLVPLMPDAFRADVSSTVTPFMAMINLSVWLGMLTLLAAVEVFLTDDRWWLLLIVVGVGATFTRATYLGAVSQAIRYGEQIKVAFDLYRGLLWTQFDLEPPKSLADEWRRWHQLDDWLYRDVRPERQRSPGAPITYASRQEVPQPPPTTQLSGSLAVTLSRHQRPADG